MSDTRDPQRDQPLPTGNGTPVQAALIAAIGERAEYGRRKYGTVLRTHNGRDPLIDAWEEALDLVTYLTQMRLERGDQLLPEQLADAFGQPRIMATRLTAGPPPEQDGRSLYKRILDMFGGPLPWPPRQPEYDLCGQCLGPAHAHGADCPAPEPPWADKLHEAVRQMDADANRLIQTDQPMPTEGMVVQPYRDHGRELWVFRCWGTDTCDGALSLGNPTAGFARQARDRHAAEHHSAGAEAFARVRPTEPQASFLDDIASAHGVDFTGLRGLLEHVGIDTAGRDVTVDGEVIAPASPPAAENTPRWGDNRLREGIERALRPLLSDGLPPGEGLSEGAAHLVMEAPEVQQLLAQAAELERTATPEPAEPTPEALTKWAQSDRQGFADAIQRWARTDPHSFDTEMRRLQRTGALPGGTLNQ